jgi:hypothetical protein
MAKYWNHSCDEVTGRERSEAKFWDAVTIPRDVITGCWFWQKGVAADGYGRVTRAGRKVGAHRAAWEIFHGRPPDGWVLHSCDNPRCVNPAHLSVGSHRDNMRDMRDRGRGRSGSAKITEGQAREIKRNAGAVAVAEMAATLGVSTQLVRRVINGTSWRGVTP